MNRQYSLIPSERVKKMKKFFKSQIGFLISIIIVLGLLVALINPRFLSVNNVTNLFKQVSVTGICALASAIVLIGGGFDLSVGTLLSLVACTISSLVNAGLPEFAAILCGILVGTLGGAMNGFIISKTGCAPVIVTLGSMGVFKGAALLIAGGNIINFKQPICFLGLTTTLGIPTIIIIFAVMIVFVYFILRKTVFGRRVYSIGGNAEAAFLSGVNIGKTTILIYALDGFIVSFAAIALLMRLGSASAVMGDSYTLDAVASAVIGGVAITGGKGTVLGCVLGILLLGIISNAMNLLGVTAYLQEIVLGAIVVIAAAVSMLGVKKK